mmetsp:Transcript_7144/g.17419  ORF Transcript_7144/g.17419 Transcript_7144/m.17419 type:complete len:675 (-) Transcript_7144:37-2061(-)|eukprot:CAMPEP_0197175504 /NCGR_PEP_ID=MMETSP1423-20130617/1705_1 /TAXON_ID=476441 /ORGANISM="Pseudo-nitzschia heimii, Strain UNC1101" /LENGTH=674 /DNA_ID=CAMNT_0042624681 /DNA_START=62 /DNA_END=2086 /DNA_ORIENTATION=+
MVQKPRLRIALGVLGTACLVTNGSAFVSRMANNPQVSTGRTENYPQRTHQLHHPLSSSTSSSSSSTRSYASSLSSTATPATGETESVASRQEPLPTPEPMPAGSDGGDDEAAAALAPIPTEWQGHILSVLSAVVDPDLGQDIVTLGFVQKLQIDESTRRVSFDVELTTPACPVKEAFQTDCENLVLGLPFVGSVDVTMTAQAPANTETETMGMAGVGAVIAVSSCKGGVGKSTTSVNLAYALQSLGASVGIFDADVYGPSLPTMVEPDNDIVRFIGRQIAPLQRNGVKLMSFGYINDGSAVMRGPMVSQLLDQFLSVTQWGSLDYLILDMPPGTGDIQLTLTQRLNITAAVIVTTPQELSFADVVRGVEMFDTVNVPCIAVVENMAYYESEPSKSVNNANELERDVKAMMAEKGLADDDGIAEELVRLVLNNARTEPVRIFGPGHKERLSSQWGIEHTYSMPLMDRIAANGDSGTPFVLGNPDSPQTNIYKQLAKAVVSEVAKTKFSTSSRRPEIEYIEEFGILMVDEEPLEPAELRRACRCAACVEEMTGRQILQPSDVPDDIKPLRMASTGNYALSVDWSDGHRSLFPYRQIRKLVYGDDDDEVPQAEFQQRQEDAPTSDDNGTEPQQGLASETTTQENASANEKQEPPVTTPKKTISPPPAPEEKTCSCCP